jgi:hypothetical protein
MFVLLPSLHDPDPRVQHRQAASACRRLAHGIVMIALVTPLMAVPWPLAVLLLASNAPWQESYPVS